MSKNSILTLRKDIDKLHNLLITSVDELEATANNSSDCINLNDRESLSSLMKKNRRETGISMEDLALQTDLSNSTLKRIFLDPSNAKFSSVIKVMNELGINSWAEK